MPDDFQAWADDAESDAQKDQAQVEKDTADFKQRALAALQKFKRENDKLFASSESSEPKPPPVVTESGIVMPQHAILPSDEGQTAVPPEDVVAPGTPPETLYTVITYDNGGTPETITAVTDDDEWQAI